MKFLIHGTCLLTVLLTSQFALAHPGHTTELFHNHETAPLAFIALGLISAAAIIIATKVRKKQKQHR